MRDRQCTLNHDATESAPIVSGVINKPTTVELCIPPVYRRLAVAKFLKVHNVEIAHVTLTTPTYGALTHHKTKTSHGRPVYEI